MKPVAFFVQIQSINDGYEKYSHTLVKGECKEKAITSALLAECHNSLGAGAEWLEEGLQIEDLNGDIVCTLHDCKPVTAEQLKVLEMFY